MINHNHSVLDQKNTKCIHRTFTVSRCISLVSFAPRASPPISGHLLCAQVRSATLGAVHDLASDGGQVAGDDGGRDDAEDGDERDDVHFRLVGFSRCFHVDQTLAHELLHEK